MATVTETRTSGTGNKTGINGMSASREFYVDLDASGVADDFTGEVDNEDDPLSPIIARYPAGTQHHIPGFAALFVSGHEVVERDIEIPQRYTVKVVYDHPLVPDAPLLDGWSVRMTSATEMVPMIRDLNNKWIGGHVYRKPLSPEVATHTVKTGDGTVELVQEPDAINQRPIDIFTGVGGVAIQGTAYLLTWDTIERASYFRGKVNSSYFYGTAPAHLLCTHIEVTARPADAQFEAQTGLKIAYDVALEFLQSPERPFTPVTLFDFYTDSKGNEVPVEGANTSQSFDTYAFANFTNLLRLFGSTDDISIQGKPRRVGGIRPVLP